MKEDQLREDQRREALARLQEPSGEETLPPPAAPQAEIEQPAPPRVVEQPQPRIDSKALLESDGLVMIETDRSKAPVQPPAEQPQQLGRPRRERSKPLSQEEEELKQVETRK